jgi:hypothetical protein
MNPVPEPSAWSSAAFLLLFSLFPLAIWRLVGVAFRETGQAPDRVRTWQVRVLAAYSLFFVIVSLVAMTGFFNANTLPPRIILFIAVPLAVLYLLLALGSSVFKQALRAVPASEIIRVHVLRFIGIVFLLLAAQGALPTGFAQLAGWGDIVAAALAWPVAWALDRRLKYSVPLALAWNTFGLVDILNVLRMALSQAQQAVEQGESQILVLSTFPYALIPSFAPATIIFMHVIIYRKLLLSPKTASVA